MPTPKKVVRKPVAKPATRKSNPMAYDPFGGDAIKINIYGRSGTGKTSLWSTFPGPIKVFLCSSLSQPGELRSVAKKDRSKITPVLVTDTTKLAEELADVEDYATVVLDHATGLQDLVLKEILGIDELPPQLSWGLATQQNWGQVGIKMKEILRSILNSPTNVVIVAQEREFDGGGEETIVIPYVASALSPSVTGWLNPACDYIVQTFIRRVVKEKTVKVGTKEMTQKVDTGEVEYCLRTGPDSTFTTKFRLPRGVVLPDVVIDPTYDKIKTLIDGD